jgi:hypothetical protein
MLHRHAKELSGLNAEQADIETLEQLLSVFTKRHLASSESESASNSEQTISVAQDREDALPEPPHNGAAPAGLQVHHQVSPNFGVPLRKSSAGR